MARRNVEQADTVAIPKRVQLAGAFEGRDDTFAKTARIINGYAEREGDEYWIYKRPGFSELMFTPPSPGSGRGVYYFDLGGGLGKLISIVGRQVFSHNVGTLTGTLIGTLPLGASSFTNSVVVPTGAGTNVLLFGDGTTAFFTDGATVTQLLGPPVAANGFPFGTNSFNRGWAYLDGFTFVMRNGRTIQGTTNLDDPVSWDLLNVIEARTEPDEGVFLTKHLNYVMAMKRWTTDFFYDAGNPAGSPLTYVQGATLPFGILHAGTAQDIDGINIWIGTNKSSGPQAIMFEGMRPKIISNPSVERILKIGSGDSWFSSVFKLGGHRFYTISTQNLGFTLVYDIDQGLWYQWTDSEGNRWLPTYVTYLPGLSGITPWTYVAQDLSGKLYFMGEQYTYANDAGTVTPIDIYTPDYDAGTKRIKQLGMMQFDTDRIQGSLKVRHNDNDYDPASWSNFREVDMSVDVPKLPDCGSFVSRAWNFRYEGNTPFRMKTVDLQIDVGTG